jgi:hypothetical protein
LWVWLLSNASKLRDLALAGAAGTYAVGFIIWSIHASVNDLGLLPALDSQYIIAGLAPIILVGTSVAAVYFGVNRIHISPRVRWATNAYKILVTIIFVTVTFIFVLYDLLPVGGLPLLHNIVERYAHPSFTTWEYTAIILLIYVVFLLNFVLILKDRPSRILIPIRFDRVVYASALRQALGDRSHI